MKRNHIWIGGLLLGLLTSFEGVACAQTSPDLLVKPWADGQAVDTNTEGIFEPGEHLKEGDQNIDLSSYHAWGRWWTVPGKDAAPRIGYDVRYFDVEQHDPLLPRHLWEGTVGFAQPVALVNNWFVVVTGAAGYSGESPFSDPHAAYFTGNVIVGREFSKDKAIVVALNYDGNRILAPDIPIPGFAYSDRYNEHLTYVIGLPYSYLTYQPINGLQVDFGYSLVTTFSARVGYEFIKHLSVYGSYADQETAFHLSRLSQDRRLFLQEHRLEIGFRYNPTPLIRISIGGGWAFGQEFTTGYDVRGLNAFRHISDGPFARALIEFGV